ncbi:hypothetical protein GALMADRAFT_116466 [Galerina marginata CBS 339.88]|uniref:DUF2855 family protein n=1 Tax=Galerina marginata (strain CBS 339.88) TaxID=685588 RepID=A0A067T9V0_GALM3|nr:hypothetical protein GALMADRAFT_116466 [Galerina marginata CBS 339.88]
MPNSTPSDPNITLSSPRPSSGQDPHSPVIVVSQRPTECPQNHVLIKVDRFGFSANNVTYQALGEHPHFRYFDFHSAPESTDGNCSRKTHGLIPVWGFGTVIKSTHPKISEGERVYGYLAPTRYLLLPVSPNDVNKTAFYVPRPHLPADRRPYNQILRCNSDPHYTPTPVAEDLTMLYRPLFWTSYWCEDWLYSSQYRGGVSTILISSASSKTAFCLAYLVGKRIRRGEISPNTRIIGLTSKRNMGFTKKLGLYHEVFDYDSFTSVPAFQGNNHQRWLYIDVAGNDDLNKNIFAHFASPYTAKLAAVVALGMTNLSPSSSEVSSIEWSGNPFDATATVDPSNVASPFWPKVEQFFMPEWLEIRRHQIPIQEIFSRQNQAWKELMTDCLGWVELERVYGAENVKEAYGRLAKEGLGPDKGLIWSLWDEETEIPKPVLSRL